MTAADHHRPGYAFRLGTSAFVMAALLPVHAALALEPLSDADPAPWYVVGNVWGPVGGEKAAAGAEDDRLVVDDLMSRQLRIDFNYGAGEQPSVLSFSEDGRIGGLGTGAYTLMFSGSYDVRTGTAITPRISAGVGVASRFDGVGLGIPGQDPSRADDMAPAFQLGLGADYAVSDNWAFSAEYRAFYEGASETEAGPVDPRVSQQFTVGAKIRF